jgi:5-methylcytosine-specific restriction endonuclease McrA
MSTGWGGVKGWGTRGGSTRGWRRVRSKVLERDGYRCRLQLPGCTVIARHVHHTTTWVGRPEDVDPGTLQASCASCNLKRGDRPQDPEPRPWS